MAHSGGTQQRARAYGLQQESRETLRVIEALARMLERSTTTPGLGRFRVRDFGCCDGQTHTQTKVRIES